MALRFGKYRYTNILGEKGSNWTIEIWKKDYADINTTGGTQLYPELPAAREFSSVAVFNNYWNNASNWAYTSDNGGAARHSTGSSDALEYDLSGGSILESGVAYEVTIELAASNGYTDIIGSVQVKLGTAATSLLTTVGVHTEIVTSNGTQLSIDPLTAFVGDVKEISVKKYFAPALEFNTGGEGFEITWNGQGGTRDREFLGSECKLNYIVENATDESFLYDSVSQGYKEYYIRIYKSNDPMNRGALWWFGWVQPAFDAIENMPFPYEFNLTATDSYGFWGKSKDEFFSNEDEKNAPHNIKDILLTIGTDMSIKSTINTTNAAYGNNAPIPVDFNWLRTSMDWWSSPHTYNSDDPAALYFVSKGFVSKPTTFDDDGNIEEDQDSYKYKPSDVFDGVLKSFNTVGFLAEGCYNFIQPNNLASNTSGDLSVYEYNSSTESDPSNPLTLNTLLTINQSSNVILQGSTINYEPSFERVIVNHKGGFSNFDVGTGQDLTTSFLAGSLQSGLSGQLQLSFFAKHYERITIADFNLNPGRDVVQAGFATTATLTIRITDGTNERYLVQTSQSNILQWQSASGSITIKRGYGVEQIEPINNEGQMCVGLVSNPIPNNPIGNSYGPMDVATFLNYQKFYSDLIFEAFVDYPDISGNIYIQLTADNDYYQGNAQVSGSWPSIDYEWSFLSLNDPTPVQESTTCENITLIPTEFNNDNDVTNGIIYTASQTNNTAIEQFDLGDVNLGQSQVNNLYSFQYNSGSIYEVAPGFRRGNSGSYINASQLLVNEFLQLQVEPLEVLQADIQSADISPLKLIKYSINDDGSYKYYSFLGGTFKAQSEILSGEWYKVNSITTNIIEENSPDGPTPGPTTPPTPLINQGLINEIVKSNELYGIYGYGKISSAIDNGATDTKITLDSASKGKIYSGQKLLLTYPDRSNPLVLTASGDSTTSDTQIDLASFTLKISYPKGSVLSPLTYDLTNVITGGGGTPGGSDTQVQFNNSGAFGGTDLLKITGANELTIGGTNTNTKLNAGADIILGADVAGGTTSTIQYLDSGSTERVMLGAYATDVVVLSNRAADGIVEIRANTSSAGSGGELTIATFKDTSVDFLADAELRGTNIGNIFDLTAYLTAVDFTMSTDRSKVGYSRTNGAAVRVDSTTVGLLATFQVPIGYEATHVQVNGSSSSSTFDVYACDASNNTNTSLTSSPSVNTNQALSSAQSGVAGKYLSIKFIAGSTSRDVYGAKITLARV
jgi:hypothetical protein